MESSNNNRKLHHIFGVDCSKCGKLNEWDIERPTQNVVMSPLNGYRVTCQYCGHTDDYRSSNPQQVKSRQAMVGL